LYDYLKSILSTKINLILNNEQYNNVLIRYTFVLTRVVVFVVNLLCIDWFLFLTRTHIVMFAAILAFHCHRVPPTAAKKKWFVWSLLEATQNFTRIFLDFIYFFTNTKFTIGRPTASTVMLDELCTRETSWYHDISHAPDWRIWLKLGDPVRGALLMYPCNNLSVKRA